MESFVLKLSVPITFGQDTITEVTFRQPVFKDYKTITLEAKTAGVMLDFATKLSNQPPAVMDRLSRQDTFKVLKLATGFFDDGEEGESGESA